MSDIQAYLASKYMSGARADAILSRSEAGRPKKKKRRIDQALPVAVGDGTGLLIADEDSLGNAWGQAEPEEEDTDAPVVTAAAKTLRLKKSNWSLPSASSSTQPEPAAEDPPAGSSTATATSAPPVKKRKGGLLTAAQLKEEAEALAIEEARKEAEREQERLEARRQRQAEGTEDDEDDIADDDNHPDHQRTVYRDRSGKIVDAQAERAEQLKAEAEDRARQAAKKDWNKGLVQRNQREVEAQRERQVASTSFARSANDRDMNDELRNEVRREDPAAAFLTKRKKKGPQRPKYTGPTPPPNRFGIPPGFRWDGVDRSTGYEAKLFQKINERSRKAREAYQWSTEEM